MFCRRLIDDRRGATAVEFALVSPLLVLILFAIIEYGIMGLMGTAFENAVLNGARAIRTGQADGPTSADELETQLCARIPGAAGDCRDRLSVSVRRAATFNAATAAALTVPDGAFDKGSAGDIIVVRAAYRWPMVFPNFMGGLRQAGVNEVVLDARTAFKNEPYE